MKGVPVTAIIVMSRTLCRRSITALILTIILLSTLSLNVYAKNTNGLGTAAEDALDRMGAEAFVWYQLLLSISLPVLICRYASHGFMLLGNTFMTKGEYALDRIKKDIFYSSIALVLLALLPQILSWSMNLFAGSQWHPPSPSYIP